ncbi:hypothetical protein HON59_00755 [bacterium]|nr:hypothetical protein [bacterium]MBT4894581.1 hypothetical protein [bacterium]
MDLNKELNKLASKQEVKTSCNIEFGCEDFRPKRTKNKIEKINKALSAINDEEARIGLTKQLLRLWRSKEMEKALSIFGEMYNRYTFPNDCTATLAAQGRQFRVWRNFPPGKVERNHVDSSGGQKLILGVYGTKKFVKKYIEMYTLETCQREVCVNGCKLYLPYH